MHFCAEMSPPSITAKLKIGKDAILLCSGREPTTGLKDDRFILRGDAAHPDVRIWPGFRSQRTVNVKLRDDEECRSYVCTCSIEETPKGPLFVASGASDSMNEAVNVVGSSMTAVARSLLGNLLRHAEEDGDGDDPKYVKGPHFFGLRTAEFCRHLDKKNFPADDSAPAECTCSAISIGAEEVQAAIEEQSGALNLEASVRWNGVLSLGEPVGGDTTGWSTFVCGERLALRKGFSVSRDVRTASGQWMTVKCEVTVGEEDPNALPYFKCTSNLQDGTVSSSGSHNMTCAVKKILTDLGAVTKHHWGGDFFGFHLPHVKSMLTLDDVTSEPPPKQPPRTAGTHPLITRLRNIRNRGGGPTSSLQRKDSRDRRNETIHDLVQFASFGDVQAYITWLTEHHPALLDEALEDAVPYCDRLTEHLAVRASIKLSEAESAELLLGRAQLSQRAYKALKKSLKKKKVYLASYKKTMQFVDQLKIGSISGSCGDRDQCMCALTDFSETIKLIFSRAELYQEMRFPSPEQQKRVLEQLHSKYPALYSNTVRERMNHRTIFIRETGDNFRAAGRQQTEQDYFTILNLQQLITSPSGQFVNGIWRGQEGRAMLEKHLSATYCQMDNCVRNGITVTLPDGRVETFNVVVFYIADYSHKKEVLGRVAVNGKYGCIHCKKPIDQWGKLTPPAQVLTTKEMVDLGAKAQRELGPTPDKNSKAYEKFSPTKCFAAECNLSCSLHMTLAIHRQLWKHVDHVVSSRNQAELLSDALKTAGCSYMAFQMDKYILSKQKRYDGNEQIRMTGEDCRQLEMNIGKFVQVLCRGKPLSDASNQGLQHIVSFYSKFHDIAQDLRSTSGNLQRAKSFRSRVNGFVTLFQKVGTHDCTKRVMYVHVLIDHIPKWIVLWCELMGWGYGIFTTTSGEHLNKQVKLLEIGHSDLSGNRYQQILRMLRVRMFHFPSLVLDDPTRDMRCSRCNQKGHNKKNKCCPMHPSQPPLYFSDTDADDEVSDQ